MIQSMSKPRRASKESRRWLAGVGGTVSGMMVKALSDVGPGVEEGFGVDRLKGIV
jgi:hypothetical protein